MFIAGPHQQTNVREANLKFRFHIRLSQSLIIYYFYKHFGPTGRTLPYPFGAPLLRRVRMSSLIC